jgi:hypothetical protein
MEYIFVTRLNNIKIAEPLYKGVELCKGLYLANDDKLIKQLLTSEFVEWAGKSEAGYLGMSDAYLYATTARALDEADPIPPLNDFLGIGQLSLVGLWLVKDNSVNTDTGFLIRQCPSPIRILAGNHIAVRFSNSSASFETTDFSREQLLKEAARLMAVWLGPQQEISGGDDADLALFGSAGRLHRLVYFVQAARAQNRLPVKIALYCACLETLFSTDSNELRHRLSERVARVLGQDPTKRREIYDQLRSAYDIRSAVIHSDILTSKYGNSGALEHYSATCDQLLRRAIRKILLDADLLKTFSGSKKTLNAFFTGLIFE